MTSNTTSLSIVDLNGADRTDLRPLDVEEVNIVSANVDASEEQQCISALAMKPDGLVERKPPELGSEEAHEVSAHRQEDHHDID